MVTRKTAVRIRKTHRYLGLFIGIQFLLWTVGGLYFSWTNIDNIHGDPFKNLSYQPKSFDNLVSPSSLNSSEKIHSIALRDIAGQPYYWVNNQQLFNAQNGCLKPHISEEDALYVAKNYMNSDLKVASVSKIDSVGPHHEYREKLLPAYVISYQNDAELKAYVSLKDGKFQTVRHRDWRWFDFLWMAHTMDYETRDNFNNYLLRAFSLLGLITVLSGFLLWYTSSVSVRRLLKRFKK